MEIDKILEDIRDLFKSQRFAVVATSNGGHPYTNIVSFSYSEDLKSILFVTKRNTRKFRNISSEPRTSVLVDNRKNSPSDLAEACFVTILGKSKEVQLDKDEKIKKFLNLHPYMSDFTNEPDCAIIELVVDRFLFVRNFQDVVEIEAEQM
ncbi:MAG: pyridoxamine 5'-phosphate oxidase family protein [Thermoplasmata archaeon]|nr:MAG: pyridoxamine 5'-phosphate oxidase family protein [Thermoplasmata archaeon]